MDCPFVALMVAGSLQVVADQDLPGEGRAVEELCGQVSQHPLLCPWCLPCSWSRRTRPSCWYQCLSTS